MKHINRKIRKENIKKEQSHCCAFLWLALPFCFGWYLLLQRRLKTEIITTKDINEHKSIIMKQVCYVWCHHDYNLEIKSLKN